MLKSSMKIKINDYDSSFLKTAVKKPTKLSPGWAMVVLIQSATEVKTRSSSGAIG